MYDMMYDLPFEDLPFEESAIETSLRLRSFYGRTIDQMPLLLSGKNNNGKTDLRRTPITVKQVLYERVHGAHKHDRTLLRNNYVYTGVAVIVDPDGSGETIVGLYSGPNVKELVDSLNPKSISKGGSLEVNTDQYQTVKKDAFVLSPDTANALRENAYSEQKARESFWDYVAEGDAGLVIDNLDLVQEVSNGDMSNRMGLYLSPDPGLQLVCVGSIVHHYSDANSKLGVDSDSNRLVGIVAEPLLYENLESKVSKNTDVNT